MDELIERLRNYAKWAEKRPLEIPILLPVYLRQAADELEKAREIVVLWDMYGGSEGITDAFERAEKARWIPFEEKQPEDAQDILVWGPSYDHVAVTTYYALWGPGYTHTHWMTMPAPPKEDKP